MIERFVERVDLIEESEEACGVARTAVARKRRRQTDQDRKVARVESPAMLGELSSAGQVLESGDLALGNLSTLRALTNPEKRPPFLRGPARRELLTWRPVAPFQLDKDKQHPESASRSCIGAIRSDERTFVSFAGV